jgi:DNA mismatch repair ATPase MutS
LEEEPFTSPKLTELQAALRRKGLPPSAAINKLDRRVNFLEAAHNPIIKALDPLIFWRLQFILAIDRWRERFGPALREWIAAAGEIEALLSIAGYAYENPNDIFPEFIEPELGSREPCFRAQEFAHPLIPPEKAVRNDLELGSNLAVIVLSGPNMAGKSTFLRGIGVNVVLAQCGSPVRARRLQLSRLAVTASICVLDSLEGGVSRFYAEIRRLKQIVDLTDGPMPVLFLLDELLSGTNSRDRLIGTLSIVTKLVEQGAIGLVTTHDLALTHVPEAIGSRATNCHFEDHIQNGELRFDYKLRPGIVQTSNALALMRSIGLEI